jgi:hypothetical protein
MWLGIGRGGRRECVGVLTMAETKGGAEFRQGAAAVMQAGSVLQVRRCSVGSTATRSEVRESARRREPHGGLGLLW